MQITKSLRRQNYQNDALQGFQTLGSLVCGMQF